MPIIASDTEATPPSARNARTRNLTALIRRYFSAHWGWFAVGTGFAALTSLAAASYGYLLKLIVEGLEDLAGGASQTVPAGLWVLIAIVAGAATLRAVSLYLMTLANNTGVQRAITDVQTAQFDALTDGRFARMAGAASGGFVSRFINDVTAIREAGLRLANNLTKGVLTIIGVVITMFIMDWKLTLVLLLVYPVAILPVVSLGNRVRKRAKQAQQQVGEVSSLLSESFQSARIVKAYGLESYQKTRARAGFVERARLFLSVLRDKAAVDPILEVTGGLALVGILALTAWRIASGDTSLGNFVGIIGAVAVAAPEVRALGTLNAVAQEGGAAADRVFDILDEPAEETAAARPQRLESILGNIRFEAVSFDYPDGSPALKHAEFEVKAGQNVAIVGPSGAGKSTLFNLLLGLYQPTVGRISLDGHDISAVPIAEVRAALALVSQDAALFDDTIAANIALGKPGASQDEITAAAQTANAHDFIEALPLGYQSPAGEAGRNFSGGQRQRIAFARAILRGAPVLLLDEATSALDAESEAKVQEALSEHAKGRTVLVIAHRLSTVRAADRILVMEEGQIVESGTHDELMQSGTGLYRRLADLQLR